RLVIPDPLAGAYARQNAWPFVCTVRRNEDGDGPADHFGCRVAEQALGAAVPGGNDALEVLGDDGVVGMFDDCRIAAGRNVTLVMREQVHQYVDGPDQLAGRVEQWCRGGKEGHLRAVRPFGNRHHAANGAALLKGKRHRALAVRHRGAVEVEELPGAAELASAQLRTDAPQFLRGPVVVGDTTLRVGGVDGLGHGVEDPGCRQVVGQWKAYMSRAGILPGATFVGRRGRFQRAATGWAKGRSLADRSGAVCKTCCRRISHLRMLLPSGNPVRSLLKRRDGPCYLLVLPVCAGSTPPCAVVSFSTSPLNVLSPSSSASSSSSSPALMVPFDVPMPGLLRRSRSLGTGCLGCLLLMTCLLGINRDGRHLFQT